MQLPVGALPARQHSGGRVVERLVVSAVELAGGGGVAGGVRWLACRLGHRRHVPQGAIRQGVAVGVRMAEVDVIPPVRHVDESLWCTGSELPLSAYSDQPVAVAVHRQHGVRPPFDARILAAQPALAAAALGAVCRRNQQGWICVRERRPLGPTGHGAVGLDVAGEPKTDLPAQVLVHRLSHHVQRGESVRQGRRVCRDVGVFVHADQRRHAARVVGQQTQVRVELQDRCPVAAETGQTGIPVEVAQGGKDRRRAAAVFQPRLDRLAGERSL